LATLTMPIEVSALRFVSLLYLLKTLQPRLN